MKRNGTERKYDVNGLDRCLVSFVPVPFIGSSGGGIAQVVHRSAVEQVVTLTAGVTVYVNKYNHRLSNCCFISKAKIILRTHFLYCVYKSGHGTAC